jgi:hypothetical protein
MTFDRVCELYIGTFPSGNKPQEDVEAGNGILVTDLHFSFDVIRSVNYFKNKAVIKIFNANDETIDNCMSTGKAVILRAGHRSDKVGNIFIGQIDECYTDRMNNGDVVTTLVCVSQRGAQYPLGRVITTVSFPAGTTYFDVLQYIADFAGVPLSGATALKDMTLESRYHDVGSITELVQHFKNDFLLEVGGDVIIDNNEMLYIQKVGEISEMQDGTLVENAGHTAFETIALTLRSGLFEAKKVRKENTSVEEKFKKNIDYYMGIRSTEKKETYEEKQKRIEKEKQEPAKPVLEVDFKCLLTPEISPNLPVYIDNRKIVDGKIDENDKLGFYGRFMVTEVRFLGDNHGGNFSCSCKGAQYGP